MLLEAFTEEKLHVPVKATHCQREAVKFGWGEEVTVELQQDEMASWQSSAYTLAIA